MKKSQPASDAGRRENGRAADRLQTGEQRADEEEGKGREREAERSDREQVGPDQRHEAKPPEAAARRSEKGVELKLDTSPGGEDADPDEEDQAQGDGASPRGKKPLRCASGGKSQTEYT